jgi:PAS domain S-box-containing protein
VDRQLTPRAARDLTLSGFVASAIVAALLVASTYWLPAGWIPHGQAVLVSALVVLLAVLYRQLRRKQQAERRLLEHEQQFHVMTDSVTDYAIIKLDAEGRVCTWNPGAQRIGGYAPEDILGRHFSWFYTTEDRAVGAPMRSLQAAAQQGRFASEGWRLRRDGSRFWAGVAITPLVDASGRITGYCKITRDLTERKSAEEQLQRLNTQLEQLVQERTLRLQLSNDALLAAKERLQDLSARLMSAQEEERRHIARELHDETGQALTLIRMQLGDLARADTGHERPVAECIRYVDGAISHIRSLSLRLRPPMLDDLGLAEALEWVVEQQARAAGWRLHVDVPQLEERLGGDVETACFRICQEALTNAARYAQATEVAVSLHVAPERLELVVADDGCGFDLDRYTSPEERGQHFGLVSMRERAALAGGRLEIDTAPGHGTRIRALFELAPETGDNPASAPGELFA